MSGLRPPSDALERLEAQEDEGTRETPGSWPAHPSNELKRSPSLALLGMAGAGLVVLVLVFVAAVVVGRAPSSAVAPTIVPPALATVAVMSPAASPTSACIAAVAHLALIEDLEKRGNWTQAAATAEAALDVPNLCGEARRPLTQKAVADGLNVLFFEPFRGVDREAEQHAVDRYLALRQRADDADVDFPTALQVANQAFTSSKFRLAMTALEIAYAEGSFRPDMHRDTTHLYVSALYGIGRYYTQQPSESDLYTEGLAYLSASHRLAVQYQTGQGEAAALLTQRIGPDETVWPNPYPSPVFAHTS